LNLKCFLFTYVVDSWAEEDRAAVYCSLGLLGAVVLRRGLVEGVLLHAGKLLLVLVVTARGQPVVGVVALAQAVLVLVRDLGAEEIKQNIE
jgi:hypothetical protein